jgi:hypothetical protein
VIGYSFPNFNREIDRLIFKEMKALRKVYIVNTPDNLNSVLQRFKAVLNSGSVVVEGVTAIDEFYIPPEY